MSAEIWRSIPGFPSYEVSNLGRVVSRKRRTPRELRGYIHQPDGYIRMGLMVAPRRQYKIMAHRLVLLAFVGPCPAGLEVRHLNGDPTDNRLANLAYGTPLENNLDTVRHGRNVNAQKTECRSGHPFDGRNTYIAPNGSRKCRTCRSAAARAWRDRANLRSAGIGVAA